jgi:hypothetical protein
MNRTAIVRSKRVNLYLCLAIFWVIFAVVLQIFWDTLKEHMLIPVDRSVVGFVCFILFSYNFIRWRMWRMQEKWQHEADEPPPRPRVHRDYDPTFDFSDSEPAEEKKKPPA